MNDRGPVIFTGHGNEAIITLWRRKHLFFGPMVPTEYRGSGTVWHNASTGKRCDTSKEMYLENLWTVAVWTKRNLKELA